MKLSRSVVIWAIITACGSSDRFRDRPLTARDSAGIRIVENVRPVWRAGDEWRLSDLPRAVIPGEGAIPEHMPLDPASAFLTKSGEIVVADGRFVGWNALLVFDSVGKYLRRMGRPGSGPCEFSQLWWARPYRGDSIAAFDAADHSLVVFDPDGSCAREVPLPRHFVQPAQNTYAFDDDAAGVFDDGSLLVILMGSLDITAGPGIVPYRHAVLRVGPAGERTDSLGLFTFSRAGWTGSEQKLAPLTLRALLHVTDDAFYYATGETFEIQVYSQAGTLQQIVRRAFRARPIQPEHRAEYVDWLLQTSPPSTDDIEQRRRKFESEAIWPKQLPTISALLVDAEGYLWVENYRSFHPFHVASSAASVTSWSIFDPDGRWLGDVTVPGRLLLSSVGADHALGLWQDPDGSSEVRLYRLSRQ
jgi:hypothetical protein